MKRFGVASPSYLGSVGLLLAAEFVLCTCLAFALVAFFPAYYATAKNTFDLVVGALLFSAMFFTFTLYPFAKFLFMSLLSSLAKYSPVLAALASGGFTLAYTWLCARLLFVVP